jgi:hypothetical protein
VGQEPIVTSPTLEVPLAVVTVTVAVLLCPVVCHLVALQGGVLRGSRTYSGRGSGPGAVCVAARWPVGAVQGRVSA